MTIVISDIEKQRKYYVPILKYKMSYTARKPAVDYWDAKITHQDARGVDQG